MPAYPESVALAQAAAKAADEKLASDITAIDVSAVLGLVDIFVVASAANPRQLAAIVDEVDQAVVAAGGQSPKKEGSAETGWVLLDFGDIVVHAQLADVRTEYALERLWRDCPSVDLDLNTAEASA